MVSNLLEATRQELGVLRPQVKVLEQVEALLVPCYEPSASSASSAPSAPAESPRRPRGTEATRPSRGAGRRNPSRAEICEHVIAHGPVTRGELLAVLGGSEYAMSAKLKSLLAAGSIAASGKPRAHRYHAHRRAAEQEGERGGRTSALARPAVSSALPAPLAGAPERGVYEVYDAILDSGGATTAQLMKLTGLTKSVVIQQARHLTRMGLVHFTRKGADRVWLPRPQSGGAG